MLTDVHSRRAALGHLIGMGLGLTSLPAYAVGIEPLLRLAVTRYHITPAGWPARLNLKIAVITDIHACEPWMSAARVRDIARTAMSLKPDLIVLLGDYNPGHRFVTAPVMPQAWGAALSVLAAPLGVYAVLGNHDWWHGPLTTMPETDAAHARDGLKIAGARHLENEAVRLEKDGVAFWLLGLGDQFAGVKRRLPGADDLPGTLARVGDDAPVILMAHEPAIVPQVPERVSLVLCGHTHGGQVNIPAFVRPERIAEVPRRYLYGHVEDGPRHTIISAGLGNSGLPVRFMRPPEVVEVRVGGGAYG